MEYDFHRWLRQNLPVDPRAVVGVGDDAAVLTPPPGEQLVVAADAFMDGVHFRGGDTAPRRIGRKALAANLSDLAAMAARPLTALVTLALPAEGSAELAEELTRGVLELAREFDLSISGGDTNVWSQSLVISVTVLGSVPAGAAWRRAGARVGDRILVTGEFGGSLSSRHLDFTPRVREALAWRERFEIHAATDVSDGLSLDLANIAEASRCGAVLELDAIPVSAAAKARGDGRSPLEHALEDGEDFELVLAAPPAVARALLSESNSELKISDIGEFVEQPGLWTQGGQGELKHLATRGYMHGS